MNTILVSYDLIAPGRDYKTLHEHLKSYRTWAKPLESLWLIKTSFSASEIRDKVTLYLDSNDRLFVINVTGQESAWRNLPDKVSRWIKDNL